MATINPYLNFKGNTEDAFNFYKSVFGGEFRELQRFKDTPEAGKVPENEKNKLMHISLPIGNENILMATDALESMGHNLIIGNNIQLSITTDNEDEAEKIFRKLSEGGKTTMPLQKTFWGSYFGRLTDKYGVSWMVSYDYKKPI
jgi:PhnB protein